jgi:general nucleoside transport system permease protein
MDHRRFVLLAVGWLLILSAGKEGRQSTFVLTSQRAGVDISAPDLVLPTAASLYLLAGLIVLVAVWQFARRLPNPNVLLSIIAGLLVIAFLVWATSGKSLNLTGMLVSSVVRATPIALAALSGIYSERSGVVNIGIEGMMLSGAFSSVVFASLTQNMLVGILAGVITGMRCWVCCMLSCRLNTWLTRLSAGRGSSFWLWVSPVFSNVPY